MSVLAVVGAQWGDEAKGKIVDMLAEKVKLVVRYSGGDNAGHTVINKHGEFVLHIIPAGIFYPHITCIIGNGMAVNPAVLLEEINNLKKKNAFFGRLFISDRVNLIMPYHIHGGGGFGRRGDRYNPEGGWPGFCGQNRPAGYPRR
jgi:adenylosuccinate synthase